MKPIKDVLAAHGVPVDDPNDATLSGSERAHAVIVAALVEQWDRLDGRQQRSIVDAFFYLEHFNRKGTPALFSS